LFCGINYFSFQEPFGYIYSRGFSDDNSLRKDLPPSLGAEDTRENFFRKKEEALLNEKWLGLLNLFGLYLWKSQTQFIMPSENC